MELYHKVGNACITNLVTYPDCSVKQVCFNPRTKEVEIYRAAPDVEDGYRYLRLAKFAFDFEDLEQVIVKMGTLYDDETMIVPVVVKPSKRLVYIYIMKSLVIGSWVFRKKLFLKTGKQLSLIWRKRTWVNAVMCKRGNLLQQFNMSSGIASGHAGHDERDQRDHWSKKGNVPLNFQM